MNGKQNTQVHSLRSRFDLETNTMTLQGQGTDHQQRFHLNDSHGVLAEWLSIFLGFTVTGEHNAVGPAILALNSERKLE